MDYKTIDISELQHEDRDQAETWFMSHTCDSAYPDMSIIEDRTCRTGVAVIAQCTCGSEYDLTDYASW